MEFDNYIIHYLMHFANRIFAKGLIQNHVFHIVHISSFRKAHGNPLNILDRIFNGYI